MPKMGAPGELRPLPRTTVDLESHWAEALPGGEVAGRAQRCLSGLPGSILRGDLRLRGGEQQLRLRVSPAGNVDESLYDPRVELRPGAAA